MNLKIFGEEIYVHISKEQRHNGMLNKGFFVGYENMKGYDI